METKTLVRCSAASGCILGTFVAGVAFAGAAMNSDFGFAAGAGVAMLGFGIVTRKLFAGSLVTIREDVMANPTDCDSNEVYDPFDPPFQTGFNPATGLPMVGMLDTGGNFYGSGSIKIHHIDAPSA